MKNKWIMTTCALFAATVVQAQSAYDTEKLLGNELNGTARFVGMGGAMGALGGDISVMGTNPAGIGIYRSNDIAVSFGFNNTATKSAYNGESMKENRTRASFDQIGFVYSNKIGNNTSLRYVNFGFNYHKSKNFNQLLSMGGGLDNLSQTWQLTNAIAGNLSGLGITSPGSFKDMLVTVSDAYQKYWNKLPVLSVLGVQTGLVDWPQKAEKVLGWNGYRNNFFSKDAGGINQYDFNLAFNIEDRVYVGATLGVYDVDYKRFTSYTEDVNDDQGQANGGYTLNNYYALEGTGIDLKLGVIVRPIESSPFRLGFAVHTPTWYELRENYDAILNSKIDYWGEAYKQVLSDHLSSDYLTYDYRMVTPWKFNVSAGTTLSGLVAVGAEYEYQDYSSTKMKDVNGYTLDGAKSAVNACLKGVHAFRIGMEARVVPEFSVRAGYNYTSAAFKGSAYNALTLYGTRTDFNNTEAKNALTFGLGYRGSVIYADLAYKYDMYKSKFYAFDDVDLKPTQVDNERHQLLLTVGARF